LKKILNAKRSSSSDAIPKRNDPQAKRSASSSRLLAIVPTHLFGLPADLDRVKGLLHDPEVTLIEDAAQAMGQKWNGKRLGTLGDVSFFSLGRGKPFSAVEGGIVVTNRIDIAERVENRESRIRSYGPYQLFKLTLKALLLTVFGRPTLFWLPKSLPFLRLGETIYNPYFPIRKMTPFQAGLSRRWREKLKEFQGYRTKNSLEWNSISETGFTAYHLQQNGNLPDYIRYPVRFTDARQRADLLQESDRTGLGIMPTYPDSINGITELRESFHGQMFPTAKKIARELVTLPVHPFLSHKDKQEIVALISQMTTHEL
jgi:dTDP-4-amino-4,6-dideoxygalactose transaminase